MNQPPVDQPPAAPAAPRPPQKAAGMVTTSASCGRRSRRTGSSPEINFLNITAMMDMMTIILVFLLKSLSNSPASLPQSQDLQLPKSILTSEPENEPEGLAVIVSKSQIIVGETVVCPVPPDAAQYGVEAKYKRGSRNDYFIVPLGSSLQSWRDSDKRIRMATGKDPTPAKPSSSPTPSPRTAS